MGSGALRRLDGRPPSGNGDRPHRPTAPVRLPHPSSRPLRRRQGPLPPCLSAGLPVTHHGLVRYGLDRISISRHEREIRDHRRTLWPINLPTVPALHACGGSCRATSTRPPAAAGHGASLRDPEADSQPAAQKASMAGTKSHRSRLVERDLLTVLAILTRLRPGTAEEPSPDGVLPPVRARSVSAACARRDGTKPRDRGSRTAGRSAAPGNPRWRRGTWRGGPGCGRVVFP